MKLSLGDFFRINSFISILNKCNGISSSPEKSIYWNTWKKMGLKSLLPKEEEVNPISLFSRKELEKTAFDLEKIWKAGFKKGCTTILGIPVTLKNPDSFSLANGLSVQRQSIPLILKITGRGMGATPLIENYTVTNNTMLQAKLYLNGNDDYDYKALSNVMFASSAFPLAFAPQKIRVCISKKRCRLKDSVEREFIDGGIFQNQPLSLGHLISKKYHAKEIKKIYFRHVDTDGGVYPPYQASSFGRTSFVQNAVELLEKFISTSRNKELYNLLIHNPGITNQISNSISHYPRAAEVWGAFWGFFDVGFREFDFLLGVLESKKEFENIVFRNRNTHKMYLPKESLTEGYSKSASWERLECLEAFYEGKGKEKKQCHSKEMQNLKIISQISLWRLHHLCEQKGVDKKKWKGCSALEPFGNKLPFISDEFKVSKVLPMVGEDDGMYFLRLLETFNYAFDRDEFLSNSDIKGQLRKKLKYIFSHLSKQQENDEKEILDRGSKIVLDQLEYQALENLFYIQFGELGVVGVQGNLNLPSWAKYDIGLDTFRLSDFINSIGNETTFAPFGGVVFDLNYFNHSIWQFQTGLSYSQSFSKDSKGCFSAAKVKKNIICDAQIMRSNLSISYLDIIKASIIGRHSVSGKTVGRFDAQFSVGFQIKI